jgi:tetratricopeptide (TPR) repeat protein
VGEGGVAEAAFLRVTRVAPQEPAAWADLGLVALQQGELPRAAARLDTARSLAPRNGRIRLLCALVAREQGDLQGTLQHLRRAVELDPGDRHALYLLAGILEQEGRAETLAEAGQRLDRLGALAPGNLLVLLERARLAARVRDAAALARTLDDLQPLLARATPESAARLKAVRAAAHLADPGRTAAALDLLQREIEPLPAFQADRAAVAVSESKSNVLLTRFLRLPVPSARSAPADTTLAFAARAIHSPAGPWAWLRVEWLNDAAPLTLIAANARTVWISWDPQTAESHPFPGGSARTLSPNAVAPLDYDYDFRVDLALAGEGGLRLLHQTAEGSFTDATARAIPARAAREAYDGVWAADLDMDGDLDLVLARAEGAPLLLSNRGDGSFVPRPGFEGVRRLRDFAWADLDGDGDPDAILLDAGGGLRLFRNERAQIPQFEPMPGPAGLGAVQAVAVGDVDQDGTLDLVLLRPDGSIVRASPGTNGWSTREIARWPGYVSAPPGAVQLRLADLDNNGSPDLIASSPAGTRVWLNTAAGFRLRDPIGERITALADLSGSGRLDLLGAAPTGALAWLVNQGRAAYHSTTIRPRAASATGDRRINPFGIGGEVELRAGLLYQKQPITSPTLHFGVGLQNEVNVVRIIWPNGYSQADFNVLPTTEAMLARQRLKGSCPFVFAYDGKEMRFVTDFIWRTALGLRLNTLGESGRPVTAVMHAPDWVRIRGDQLAPHGGFYDVSVTAELWESHFFDQIELMTVDHPVGTEALVDERFTLPPPPLGVVATGPLHPVAGAWDQDGRDVSSIVRELDERYLDSFQLGPYQGIATEHYAEVALPDDAPRTGPLWLVASGWLHPTDATVNVAVFEGNLARPHGLRLEVADGRGGWVVAAPDLGFPDGRVKTILVDLRHAFRPGAPRRLRLYTNAEIYWDRIAWAVGRPDAQLREQRLLPDSAVIRFRGFSVVRQPKPSSAEIPDYNHIATTAQRWRDLEGYYTRYGDIRPLFEKVDDRYSIMNAGDEIFLRFKVPPPPPPGWTRDFVLIGDGWAKDGDFNTGFSKTLMPLPYHGLADYSRKAGRLEDDPGYRRHPDDWRLFHTRYVDGREFQQALAPEAMR